MSGERRSKTLTPTRHLLDVLRERNLELEWVERTILAPDWTEPDRRNVGGRRFFGALPERGGRYLRVACVETETDIRILSAFLDRRARPK